MAILFSSFREIWEKAQNRDIDLLELKTEGINLRCLLKYFVYFVLQSTYKFVVSCYNLFFSTFRTKVSVQNNLNNLIILKR